MPHPYWPPFDLAVRTPRLTLRAITDEVVHAISKLSGQEYTDVYATTAGRPTADAVVGPAGRPTADA